MEIDFEKFCIEVCKRCKQYEIDTCDNCPVGIGETEEPIKQIKSDY